MIKIFILGALMGCQTTIKFDQLSSIPWGSIELDKPSTIAGACYVSYITWSHEKAKKGR